MIENSLAHANDYIMPMSDPPPPTQWKFFSSSLKGQLYMATDNNLWVLDMSKTTARSSINICKFTSTKLLYPLKNKTVHLRRIGGIEAKDETGENRVWITDTISNLIKVYIKSKNEFVTFAGRKNVSGSMDGPIKIASFDSPGSIVRETSSGIMMVAETTKLRLIHSGRDLVTTLSVDAYLSQLLLLGSAFLTSIQYHSELGPRASVVMNVAGSSYILALQKRKYAPLSATSDSRVLGVFKKCHIISDRHEVMMASPADSQAPRSMHLFTAPHFPFYDPMSNSMLYDTPLLKSPQDSMIVFTKLIRTNEASFRRNCAPDLTCLITSNVWPHELYVQHTASNGTWGLHYEIIDLHARQLSLKKTVLNIIRTVRYSPLPLASVDAFISYLYFKPIFHCENLDHVVRAAHVILLCSLVQLHVEFPAQLFQTRVIRKLSKEMLYDLLLGLCLDATAGWTAEHVVIQIILQEIDSRRLKPHFFNLISNHSEASKATAILDVLKSSSSLPPLRFDGLSCSLRAYPLYEIYDDTFYRMEVDHADEEQRTMSPFDPAHFLQPGEFAVTTQDSKRWIVTRLWMLYALWPFFRVRYDSEPMVRAKRRWRAPAWMTHNMLQAIVGATHNDLPYHHLIGGLADHQIVRFKEALHGMSHRICSKIIGFLDANKKHRAIISKFESAAPTPVPRSTAAGANSAMPPSSSPSAPKKMNPALQQK